MHVDGRTFTHPYRSGQTHFLYLSDLAHIDFTTRRHTLEVVVQRSLLREICDDLELPHSTYLGTSLYHMADDPVLAVLAVRIYPFFDAPDTVDPLFADHFMWSLGTHPRGHYGDLVHRRPITGGLGTWQERLAKEVIEFNLVDGIGLTELAALCGLGTSQFSHAFKRSTGVAPYQWLLLRRLARARELMMTRSRALADIALESGFADQSHMTRAFARHFGVVHPEHCARRFTDDIVRAGTSRSRRVNRSCRCGSL